MVTHTWGSLHIRAPETVWGRCPLCPCGFFLSNIKLVVGAPCWMDLLQKVSPPRFQWGIRETEHGTTCSGSSLPTHSHSLDTATVSYCCPCPFSNVPCPLIFFFIKMKPSSIFLSFLTLDIQFYMHVHICIHRLCMYKENLNKIKH